ncbi:hypothetical protein IE077_001241, partial [Cardiosporidium cionae]
MVHSPFKKAKIAEMKAASMSVVPSSLEPTTFLEAAIEPIVKESTATLPFRPSHALITVPPDSKSNTENLSDDAMHCRNMIAFIGDNPNDDIPTRIVELSELLLSEIPRNEALIIDMLMQCIPVLSVKTGIYAALVGIIHTKHPDVTQKLLDKIFFEFDIDVKRGKYQEAMLLLRFYVALASSNAIKMESVLELLKSLMSMATSVVLQEKKAFTCDYPVYLALTSLPWISSSMYEIHKATLEDLIQQAIFYLSNRKCIWKAPIHYFKEQEEGSFGSFHVFDRLESAVSALQSMMADNWRSKTTLRFYQSSVIKQLLEKKDNEEQTSTELMISSLSLDTLEAFSPTKPLESILRLPVTTESVDAILSDHDRWILEEYATSILAKSLLLIPVQHPQFDYIIVECIFSQMLAIPKYPSVDPLYDCYFFYFRLLHKLVESQESLRLVVEKVVHSIVKKIVDWDEECFEILVEFFAYWLSTTGFSWNLDSWLQEGKSEGVLRFVRRSMERLLRLSYRDEL